MTEVQKLKQPIRAFLRAHYTDPMLAAIIAHAQDGKLCYDTCCCLIGAVTADHPLRSSMPHAPIRGGHYSAAKILEGATNAERAWREWTALYGSYDPMIRYSYNITQAVRDAFNSLARRLLLPVLRAEQKRRERINSSREVPVESAIHN